MILAGTPATTALSGDVDPFQNNRIRTDHDIVFHGDRRCACGLHHTRQNRPRSDVAIAAHDGTAAQHATHVDHGALSDDGPDVDHGTHHDHGIIADLNHVADDGAGLDTRVDGFFIQQRHSRIPAVVSTS